MNKMWRIFLAILMLCGLFCLSAPQAMADNSTGVDLVLVLDLSHSMQTKTLGDATSPVAYVLNATQALLSQMNDDQSNAGVWCFDTTKWDMKNMYSMSTKQGERETLHNKINAKWADELSNWNHSLDRAEVGAALKQAIQMLGTCKCGNAQNIILVTDSKPADTAAFSAVQSDAVKKGIKIYSVVLTTTTGNASRSDYQTLSDATNAINGCYSCEPKDLSEKLSKIYADMTGAKLEVIKTENLQKNNNGSRELIINVPDKSVKEINVVITNSSNNSKYAAIIPQVQSTLQCSEKTEYTTGGETLSKNRHHIIKITNPAVGDWHITIPAADVSKVASITYMLSSGVAPQVELAQTSFPKNGTLSVTARITEAGVVSKDEALYSEITATLSIYNKDGIALLSPQNMDIAQSGTNYAYALKIPSSFGAGEYYVKVSLTGAGGTTVSDPVYFTLTNTPPQQKTDMKLDDLTMEYGSPIDNLNRINGKSVSQTDPIDLGAYVTDTDEYSEDKLSFEIDGTKTTPALSTYASVDMDGQNYIVRVPNIETDGQIAIKVTDASGESTHLYQKINVINKGTIFDNHDLQLTVRGEQEDNVVSLKKHEEYTIELRPIVPKNGVTVSELYDFQVWYEEGEQKNSISLSLDAAATGGPVYIGELPEQEHEAAFTLHASAKFGSNELYGTPKETTCSVKVVNHSPELTSTANSIPSADLHFDDPDGVREDSPEWTLDLTPYVRDQDGDHLTFSVNPKDYPNLDISIDGKTLKIQQKRIQQAPVQVEITAKDNDGSATRFSVQVTVKDLKEKYKDYRIGLTILDAENNRLDSSVDGLIHLEKKKTYTVKMTPYNGQDVAISDELYLVDMTVNGEHYDPIRNAQTGVYSFQFETGNKEGSYAIEAKANFGKSADHGVNRTEHLNACADNKPPVQNVSAAIEPLRFIINNPDTMDDDPVQSVDLTQYVRDPEGEKLFFTVVSTHTKFSAGLNSSTDSFLHISLLPERQACSEDVVIQAIDNDGASINLNIPVVIEDWSSRFDSYGIQLSILRDNEELHPQDGKIRLDKGLSCTVLLIPTIEGKKSSNILYEPHVKLQIKDGIQTDITLERRSGGEYVGTFQTGDAETDITIYATARIGKETRIMTDRSDEVTMIVGNVAPRFAAKESLLNDLIAAQESILLAPLFERPDGVVYWIDSFLLDQATVDITLDLNSIFTDDDDSASKLTFTAKLTKVGDKTKDLPIDQHSVLTFGEDDMFGPGTYQLYMQCTDPDKAHGDHTFTFTVLSARERALPNTLIIVTATAVILLLLRFIVHCVKPAYRSGLKLRLYFGSIPQPVEVTLPSSGLAAKRKYKLDRLYVKRIGQMTKDAVTKKALSHIYLKPQYSDGLQVVSDASAVKEMKITVGANALTRNRRKATLRVNEKVTIRVDGCSVPVGFELRK